VKVDAALFGQSEKENVQPLQIQKNTDEVQKAEEQKRAQAEELLRRQQKEEERRQVEEQARKRREEEEVAAEHARRQQAAAERAAGERAAAEAAAAAAAERARAKEEQARMEAERAAEEKSRQEREAAEAQKREEERLAQEKVNSWCKANGFGDMNSRKKSFMGGSKFPLHEAVAKNNEEMVGLMVQLGADKALKNSKGQTAEDLARKMNKGGSMDGVLAKLS